MGADEEKLEDIESEGMAENEKITSPENDDEMSIIDHLTELRRRLIRCVVAVLLGSCITYIFDEEIMQFLLAPAGKLYFMHPGEAFFSYAKVVLFSGFLRSITLRSAS